jgi:hypothetical protein
MKIRLGKGRSKIAVMGLVVVMASSTFASSLTVPCPQDGEATQRISEEDKPSIRGCPSGGTISTYSHVHASGTTAKPENQTHTFVLVECK